MLSLYSSLFLSVPHPQFLFFNKLGVASSSSQTQKQHSQANSYELKNVSDFTLSVHAPFLDHGRKADPEPILLTDIKTPRKFVTP